MENPQEVVFDPENVELIQLGRSCSFYAKESDWLMLLSRYRAAMNKLESIRRWAETL